MTQNVENNQPVNTQINISQNTGGLYLSNSKITRWSRRFENLRREVENNIKTEVFIDDLIEYNTVLDGRSMSDKLADGGFSDNEIIAAAKKKQQYWKKFEKNRFYETAQIIDIEIFSLMKYNFETYVTPLIENNAEKHVIIKEVNEKVITPILKILNEEGYDDIILNYSISDILGMLYFLTGKCHINWKNYDNL